MPWLPRSIAAAPCHPGGHYRAHLLTRVPNRIPNRPDVPIGHRRSPVPEEIAQHMRPDARRRRRRHHRAPQVVQVHVVQPGRLSRLPETDVRGAIRDGRRSPRGEHPIVETRNASQDIERRRRQVVRPSARLRLRDQRQLFWPVAEDAIGRFVDGTRGV